MEQAPSKKANDLGERVAKLETQAELDHAWIGDIDKDHENTKRELAIVKTRIAVLVALATLLGNLLYGILERVLPAAKAVMRVFPDVYAGE